MKTAIVYGSKYGATRLACQELARQWPEEVTLVDLSGKEDGDWESYDRILVGGAVYAGQLRKEVKDFLSANQDLLLNRELGLFVCGAQRETEALDKIYQDNFPAPLLAHARIRGHFGHRFDFGQMNFVEKMIVRKIVGVKDSEDRLDEEGIRKFVQGFGETETGETA